MRKISFPSSVSAVFVFEYAFFVTPLGRVEKTLFHLIEAVANPFYDTLKSFKEQITI